MEWVIQYITIILIPVSRLSVCFIIIIIINIIIIIIIIIDIFKTEICFCMKSLFTVWTGKLLSCQVFMSDFSHNDEFCHSLEHCVCFMCRTGQRFSSVCTLYVWIYKTLIKYVYHWESDLKCVSVSARDESDPLKTSQERNGRKGESVGFYNLWWTRWIVNVLFS